MAEVTTRRQALHVLGLPDTANKVDIKKAFRRLAQQYHPDKHQDASPEKKAELDETMKEITAAAHFLSDKAGAPEPVAGSDFLSTLRNISPDGPKGVRDPVKSRRERELEQQAEEARVHELERKRQEAARLAEKRFAEQEAKRKQEEAARKKRREAEFRTAPNEIQPYLRVLHDFANSAGNLYGLTEGFVSYAAEIAAIHGDQNKKLDAMSVAYNRLYLRDVGAIVRAVTHLCAASEKDDLIRFRLVLQALNNLSIHEPEFYAAAYKVLSSIDEHNLGCVNEFVYSLSQAGIRITTPDDLERVLTATLAKTPDLLVIARKTPLKKYIDPQHPISSYLEVLPMLLSPKTSEKAQISAQRLAEFSNHPDREARAEDVLRRMLNVPANIVPISKLISKVYSTDPFRVADPVESYEAIKLLYHDVIQKGVPEKHAIRFVSIVAKTDRKVPHSPGDVVDNAITFFDLAREKGLEPEAVSNAFKSFFTQARALDNESTVWTKEMRAAYREIKFDFRPDKAVKLGFNACMDIILTGFYSAYPLLSFPVGP